MTFSNNDFLRKGLGGLVAFLGLTVMLGWCLHVQSMVDFIAGSVPMVFDTGLCFAIAGFALGGFRVPGVAAKSLQTACGAILALLGGLCLLEHVFDFAVGIDFPGLHAWFNYGNTRPGRMAPNTAIGFITIGASLMLTCRVTSRPRALLALFLTYGLLAIGLTGLGGYFLGPDLLFGWAVSARMALHTSMGMIFCASALRLSWHRAEWYQSQQYLSEQGKIAFSGMAVLLVTVLTAGLGGFVVQQQVSQAALKQRLPLILDAHVVRFRNIVKDAVARSRRTDSDEVLERAGFARLGHVGDERFAMLARQLAGTGFQSVALLDADGQEVFRAGEPFAASEMVAVARDETASDSVGNSVSARQGAADTLRWAHGAYLLQTEVPLIQDGKQAGTVLLEQRLYRFQEQVLGIDDAAGSMEITLCKADRAAVECFPTARHRGPYLAPALAMDGRALPAAKALAGQTGIVDTLDDRGVRVAAAYAAVGNGLAMTVHQDTAQLYGEIRQAFNTSLLLMVFIAACGAAMLHLQLTPLTTRLVESEARLAGLARVDSLTGLPNRYALNERMHAAIHRRRRVGKGVAIMFLDVDHFKTFNDTLGHAAGDAVLKEFATRLKLAVRVTDTVARLAGDEFVIIAEGLSEMQEAEIIARAVLEKVRAPWQIAGTDLRITTSIGMAFFSGDEVSPETMLASADSALYIAKANGRDGFAWSSNSQVLESIAA